MPTITFELFKSPVATLVLEPFELVPDDPDELELDPDDDPDPDPDIVILRNGLINFHKKMASTSQFCKMTTN